MRFKATQSGLDKDWYVGVVWDAGGYVTGLGGESILPVKMEQGMAEAVAADMNSKAEAALG